MTVVKFSPIAEKYLKKLKDQKLKSRIQDAINEIRLDPSVGVVKHGDLEGYRTYDFRYDRTEYRIAYTVELVEGQIVIVILIGTHENFYKELKRYL